MGKKSHPFHSISHIFFPVWFYDKSIVHTNIYLDHCTFVGLATPCSFQTDICFHPSCNYLLYMEWFDSLETLP
ncbi:hypothetical protein FKM82_026002 [Ascaphus truei]